MASFFRSKDRDYSMARCLSRDHHADEERRRARFGRDGRSRRSVAAKWREWPHFSDRKTVIIQWRGVFPAITTQMKKGGALDLDATAVHVEVLLRSGVNGLIFQIGRP